MGHLTGDEASMLTCLPLLRQLTGMFDQYGQLPDTTPEDDEIPRGDSGASSSPD